jgi:hemolysin type calcium-binding protein
MSVRTLIRAARARRAAILIAAGGLALLGAGCSGDTDPATNVGAHSAQLNFHGNANTGPAYSYFEYWESARPANKLKTQTRSWPAGASAPFGEQVQHLFSSTAYSYRVCGADQGKEPRCVSTKQFTTGVARSHLDCNINTGCLVFQDDPGVNSNLSVYFGCGSDCTLAFVEDYCSGHNCGSEIVANRLDASHCQAGIYATQSAAFCPGWVGGYLTIKLGDLDDEANLTWRWGLTLDGGSGNDSLTAGDRPGGEPGVTLTGGTGRDTLSTGGGNDTINARSANILDPDIDASISCGAGDDTVSADRQDPISAGQNGCEHVLKP